MERPILWQLHKKNRIFARTYDFNGRGWKILRDNARARAEDSDAVLNKDIVLKLIPPSSSNVHLRHEITDASGMKVLIGAILCYSNYFMNACSIQQQI